MALCAFNLHDVICQSHLSKAGGITYFPFPRDEVLHCGKPVAYRSSQDLFLLEHVRVALFLWFDAALWEGHRWPAPPRPQPLRTEFPVAMV